MIYALARTSFAALRQTHQCPTSFVLQATRRMSSTPELTKIGFVGLGNMGLPMCLNLAKSEKTILAFDTNETALAQAQKGGVHCASSVSEIGKAGCDVIFTVLPSDDAVHAVMPALLTSSTCIFIDCSTVSPHTSRHWHTQVVVEGGPNSAMLDAPVSGGVKGAQDATLTFMVGAVHGDDALAAARPLLELMGNRVIPCGGPGNGSATKLCNNLALAAQMVGICEALNLGEALGVDPVILSNVMNTSTAQCWSSNICNPHPDAAASIKEQSGGDIAPPAMRDYQGGFGTKLMLKDLGLAVSAGQDVGVALPVGAAAKELYRMADLRGLGDKDFGVMLQFLRGK